MTAERVATLVPTNPDAELAAEFKKRLVETYEPILGLLGEINAAGFDVQITTGMGPLGKHVIAQLVIMKKF